jgi:hypothetical protein
LKANKNIAILSILCVLVILIAVIVMKPNKSENIVSDEQSKIEETNNEKNNSEDESNDIQTIEELRVDGEKEVPLIINAKQVSNIKTLTKDKVIYVDLKSLIDNKAITGSIGDKILLENDFSVIEVKENEVIITQKEENSEQTKDDDEIKPESIEITGFIKDNKKVYLSEEVLKRLSLTTISDKSVSIVNEEVTTNKEKIEEILFNNELIKLSNEDFNKIYDYLVSNKDNYVISVSGDNPTKKANASEIVEIIANGINNNYMLYSGKTENSYIVILDETVANPIMNLIVRDIHQSEHYANIRLLVKVDEQNNISEIIADTYTTFDNNDIYTFITLSKK